MADAALNQTVDTNKRRSLITASSAVGGIGVVAAATPFVMSFWPSARARAAGAPVEVDIGKIEADQLITVEWRGKVCWVLNRNKPMLESLPKLDSRLADPNSNVAQQPPYCKNEHRSIKAIGDMGGGTLGGIIYSYWPGSLPAGVTDKRPSIERSIASMQEAIKTAEENNVFFNMEVVNRFEQYMLNTCEEAVEYVRMVGSPFARVMLDKFHINIEEDSFTDAILTAGDLLGAYHVGENNRMFPGYGRIPWTEIGAALRKINYAGDVVMEPFLMPGGEVGRDIKVVRDLSVGLDIDEEAREALWFMRGLFK